MRQNKTKQNKNAETKEKKREQYIKNNLNLEKGSSMRKILQNNKGYAESPEFLPAQGLFIFKKKSVAIN